MVSKLIGNSREWIFRAKVRRIFLWLWVRLSIFYRLFDIWKTAKTKYDTNLDFLENILRNFRLDILKA